MYHFIMGNSEMTETRCVNHSSLPEILRGDHLSADHIFWD